MHLGVVAVGNLPPGDATQAFSFSDESTEGLGFVRSGVGNFPWAPEEPNRSPFFGVTENCVE